MDAHVSLEALEKFKHILNQFSTGMSVEAQKMQLHLKKTHQQLEQKHYELRRQLQMCQDPISHERAKQQLMEFERLFAGFCQAAQECIKGFQQQELMVTNRGKAAVKIDRKVGVLRAYLGSRSTGSETDQVGKGIKIGNSKTQLSDEVKKYLVKGEYQRALDFHYEDLIKMKVGGNSKIIQGREFDVVTKDKLIQAKRSYTAINKPKNFLSSSTRRQIKETVRISRELGLEPEYWFKYGVHPKVQKYLQDKGIKVVKGMGE